MSETGNETGDECREVGMSEHKGWTKLSTDYKPKHHTWNEGDTVHCVCGWTKTHHREKVRGRAAYAHLSTDAPLNSMRRLGL